MEYYKTKNVLYMEKFSADIANDISLIKRNNSNTLTTSTVQSILKCIFYYNNYSVINDQKVYINYFSCCEKTQNKYLLINEY